jgi:tRNA(Ile)-lysidine synthase
MNEEVDALSVGGIDARSQSEDVSRNARYQFLRQVVSRRGARFLATAHTADDQAETVIHRVLRGTGVEGLSGIHPAREFTHGVTLIRPLLGVRRQEVLDFLRDVAQPFRQDSTNDSTLYTRNRIRHELIPRLERDYNHRVSEALVRLANLAREATAVIDQRILELEPHAIVRQSHDEVVLDCASLSKEEPYVVRRLLMYVWERRGWPLRHMSMEKWMALASLINNDPGVSGGFTASGGVLVQRRDDELILRRTVADNPWRNS